MTTEPVTSPALVAEADLTAIGQTVAAYLEWSRTGAEGAFGEAFHPAATVVNASNGDDKVLPWTVQQFAAGVERLRATHGMVEETARSTAVDLAGNVASVRIDFDLKIGSDLHVGTDFLVLARVGDRWLITQKVYSSDRPYKGPPQ